MIQNNATAQGRGARPVPQPDVRRSGGQLFSMRDPHRKSAPQPSPSTSKQPKK